MGSGPIRINISNGLPDLDTVSIPVGGQIQFNSDTTYGLTWVPENVLSPVLTSLQPGLNPVQTSPFGQPVSYTITSKTGTRGKGTVKIGT